MKRALASLLLAGTVTLGIAACGVLVDAGNAFPCDFSQPFGTRDEACSNGWICTPQNVCQPFDPEELFPTEGNRARPTFLEQPAPLTSFPQKRVELVASTSVVGLEAPFGAVYEGGELALVSRPGVRMLDAGLQMKPEAIAVAEVVPGKPAVAFALANGSIRGAVNEPLTVDGGLQIPAGLGDVEVQPGTPLTGGFGLRSLPAGAPGLVGALVRRNDLGVAGVVRFGLPGPMQKTRFVFDPFDSDAGLGEPLDVRELRVVEKGALELGVLQGFAHVPVVAATAGFFYSPDLASPSWVPLAAPAESVEILARPGITVKHSPEADLWAIAAPRLQAGPPAGGLQPTVLSTWQREIGQPPTLRRAWPDCRPCGTSGEIRAVAPTGGAAPNVEVLCATATPAGPVTFVVRVVGSAAATETTACEQELVEPAINLQQVSAQDRSIGDRVVLGGRTGHIWEGRRLSDLSPLFLDRVPSAVGFIDTRLPDGGLEPTARLDAGTKIALTGEYVSVESDAGMVAIPWRRATEEAIASGTPVQMVRAANGWVLLDSGDPVHVVRRAGRLDLDVRFAPRLLTPTGASAPAPYEGEAINVNGEPHSMVLTAHDAVYLLEDLQRTPLQIRPNAGEGLLPQLTPEPNFPIRSMALNRNRSRPVLADGTIVNETFTALEADGGVPASEVKLAGFLVTSRNVFEFSYDGSPRRWTSQQLPLSFGEPVEVWFDRPDSAKGRVGFRDGTVFTLPDGYLLADRLPQSEGGAAPRVIDYANLGGWPVALTDRGVYVALRPIDAPPADYVLFQWERVASPETLGIPLESGRLVVLEVAKGREDLMLFGVDGRMYRLGEHLRGTSQP